MYTIQLLDETENESLNTIKAETGFILNGCNPVWLMSTLDMEPIGSAGVIDFGDYVQFCACSIRSKFRGKGYQKILIQEREKWARPRRAQVTIFKSNKRSLNNFLKSGYVANNRMQLDQEQVKEILPYLFFFANHGYLPDKKLRTE